MNQTHCAQMELTAQVLTLAAQSVEAYLDAAHSKMLSAVMSIAANLATNAMFHHAKSQETGFGDQRAWKKLLPFSE